MPNTNPAPPPSEPSDDDFGGDFDFDNEESNDSDEPNFDDMGDSDEEKDPKTEIESLAGELGQALRDYEKENGEPDLELDKFAINSVASAVHGEDMEESDLNDIIKKVKGGNTDSDDDAEGDFDFGDDEEEVEEGLLTEFGSGEYGDESEYHYNNTPDAPRGETIFDKLGNKIRGFGKGVKDIATGNAFTGGDYPDFEIEEGFGDTIKGKLGGMFGDNPVDIDPNNEVDNTPDMSWDEFLQSDGDNQMSEDDEDNYYDKKYSEKNEPDDSFVRDMLGQALNDELLLGSEECPLTGKERAYRGRKR